MIRLGPARRPRRASLTPLIDVVFLLLVFFLIAARFGAEGALPLGGGGGADWSGAPRLVEVSPSGLRLNGVEMTKGPLLAELRRLAPAPGTPVALRAAEGATLQHLVAAAETLARGGFARVAVVE